MIYPRLRQPLMNKIDYPFVTVSGEALRLIRAYDCIWSLLYEPSDISPRDLELNAKSNLQNIGDILENYLGLGAQIFDADPNQLEFPTEILEPRA